MKPIVIVGVGLAGLAAVAELRRLRLPFLLVEEASHVGGRDAALRGNGWLADAAVPYLTSADSTVIDLIRTVGLETELISLQAPVQTLRDGQISTRSDGPHLALRQGFGSLFDKWAAAMPAPILGTFVAAVRWVGDQRLFLFRNGNTGRTLEHPLTRRRIEASGVVLAIPTQRAAALAAQSRVLLPAAETIAGYPTQPAATAVFVVPSIETSWAALKLEDNRLASMIVREEAKTPSRSTEGSSVLALHATPTASQVASTEDSLRSLYTAARDVLPALPEEPLEACLRQWTAAKPVQTGIELITDPPGAPVSLALETGDGSNHERLARGGIIAAREVARRVGT